MRELGMTKKSKGRRRSLRVGPLSFTARLHLDVVDAAGRLWDALKSLSDDVGRRFRCDVRPGRIAWADVPVRALVMTCDDQPRARLFVRMSDEHGYLTGVVENDAVHVDDPVAGDHESWFGLRRRRGSEQAVVLVRRVGSNFDAKRMAQVVERVLAEDGGRRGRR